MNWFYHDAKRQIGPVTEAELVELRRAGTITADTMVWRDGMPNWMRFHEAGPVVDLSAAPANLPPTVATQGLPPFTSPTAKPKTINCPKCAFPLTEQFLNLPQLQTCPGCQTPIQVEVFPALFRRVQAGQLSQGVLADSEATCFFHEQKRAVVPCDTCGRFLCALCDCEFNGKHYCPGCLETGRAKGTIRALATRRTRHDNIALSIAIVPILTVFLTLVTAPIALIYVIWHWKSPRSIVQTSRARLVAAGVIAVLEIAAWTAYFIMA